ncbi:hypothetical protein Glove_87g78 [Diversispora epigaea]|uniref:Uncharacterized protein n=1 Tax=Diversispora epigaea TaxID=1348612 RepID=A0A397J652_9GLOM|nr:hypothetical protein Glove_87g78 [Diversispora epigaea]
MNEQQSLELISIKHNKTTDNSPKSNFECIEDVLFNQFNVNNYNICSSVKLNLYIDFSLPHNDKLHNQTITNKEIMSEQEGILSFSINTQLRHLEKDEEYGALINLILDNKHYRDYVIKYLDEKSK